MVLPQTGDRDVASMCSEGDLDGDDILVIWYYDLLPSDGTWSRWTTLGRIYQNIGMRSM